ncbi:hypothetical protein [Duganella sp. BuS-21]|uniref:hypothetical protein n=1 Tax=Duganella sp. BuS-21 TaxID=2943848 RepID=UPI0035A6A503
MMIFIDFAAIAPPLAAAATGALSAALYGCKKQWLNAALAGAAGAALALTLADIRMSAPDAGALDVNTATGRIGDAERMAIPAATSIALNGDGAREAEWRDLPARALQWQPAAADLLWLDFPRAMSLGRIFTLSVRRAPAQANWRLQLLAENKQVLAESGPSPATQLSVQWLPPVAEAMVLQARLLDAAGKTIAQGPVPLQVNEPVPLQIQGRFDAPSFDARTLNQLLSDGGAILDWSVTLGKAITRSETAREPLSAPNAMFLDAAYVEHLSPSARAALLAQAGRGVPLVILGASAADTGVWRRDFGLSLQPQSPTTEKEDMRQFGASMAMPPAGLNPADNAGGSWSVLASDSRKRPWMWQRSVGQGRVVWIGVADWHKHAISEPRQLTLWWQAAMDRIALDSELKTAWKVNDPMPLPGLRTEVCAQGVKAGIALTAEGQSPLFMQARADKADAVCAAFWPHKAGWVKLAAEGMAPGREYVYAPSDWPAWQRALRREATAQYAARAVPVTTAAGTKANAAERPMPTTPFTLLFAFCMLGLWYREQGAEKRFIKD